MVDSTERDFLAAYDAYADAIFRYCFLRLYNRSEAKDLVQEVFLRVWKYMKEKGPVRNMRPFLYKIALNLVINRNQKKTSVSLDSLMEDGFDPGFDSRDSMVDILDGLRAIEKLDMLDSKQREAVYLRYAEDCSPKEIAEIIGENENAVSVRIHRGVKKLKELLDHEI